MRILFTKPRGDYIASDARRLIRINEKKRTLPLVSSAHMAQTAYQCERCRKTFWDKIDSWPSYCSTKCERDDKNHIGF